MTTVLRLNNYLRSETFFVTLNLFQGPWCRMPQHMRQERQPCVYILASQPYGTIYIGVTSKLIARLSQHRNDALPGFTSKHKVYILVHFELFGDMERAISREKQLKRWHRQWKINLINEANPDWHDLAVGLGLPSLAMGKPRNGS